MRRLARLAALALAILAGACSSEGPTDLFRIGEATVAGVLGDDEPPALEREPTRAELERIRSAVIAVSRIDGPRAFVVPLARNGPFLTYLDANRRGLVFRGNALVATQGQAFDLEAVRFAPDDPIANPTPLLEWPERVDRVYEFHQRDIGPYIIALTCTFQRLGREEIEIVEREYALIRVIERCRNHRREVINTYWMEPDTGFAWKSRQWAGPDLPPFVIEIIRPFRG